MNLMQKLKLTAELDQIANDVATGTLGILAYIQKVKRIDEIIAELTAQPAVDGANTSLLELVQKHTEIAVRLRPQFDFERSVKDYAVSIKDQTKTNELLHELRRTQLKGSDASFLRDQLEMDLNYGVYINKHPDGMRIGKYLLPGSPVWAFIEWAYAERRLIVGPKALDIASDEDMYPANDQPLPDAQEQNAQANAEFEDEAQPDLVDSPADEAGAFYQSVIEGAEVDAALIQRAIEYAEQDESHYLLPEASKVIANTVITALN